MCNSGNMPLSLQGQCGGGYGRRRRYTKAVYIEQLAVEKYKKNGMGITYIDLLSFGFASHKEEAQITLKHCHKKQILFTTASQKPQRYHPTCLKSEILKTMMNTEYTTRGHRGTLL